MLIALFDHKMVDVTDCFFDLGRVQIFWGDLWELDINCVCLIISW